MTSSPSSGCGRPVLVSACLAGERCRYDGGESLRTDLLEALARAGEWPVLFCPEVFGELGTPRPPAWIERRSAEAVVDGEDRVITAAGGDVTTAFLRGARGALAACREHRIERAYLKERSPSCGVQWTHVGGAVVEGPGVAAAFLRRAGIEVRGVP
ncbi:MAG: DUF523 domain-containing protein [Planctomycetota bacterium]